MNEVQQFMKDHCACYAGRNWAKQYKTLAEVWDNCEWGDWLIWLADEAGVLDRKTAVEISVWCSERVLPKWEKVYLDNDKPRKAIEAAKAWLSNPCEETRQAAARAADAAANTARAATYAAKAVAYAAKAATYAAYAATYAANTATDKRAEQQAQAEYIRYAIPNPWRDA